MAVVTMRQLLEAGVHFGHQTRRWNPKMKRFIYGERNGIYIIDLQKTMAAIEATYAFLRDTVAKGGNVLFVGTKKQAQESIKTQAERVGMPFVNFRWLGGMLTNFTTIYRRLQRLKELEAMVATGATEVLPKKEVLRLDHEREKLERNLGGIRDMTRLPAAVWVVDTRKEHIAVTEARKLGIPVVAILDTNCDPDEVDYPIPGNDDAIRAGSLLTRIVADAVAEGLRLRSVYASEAAGKEGAAGISASPVDEEPLAEWERELLESEGAEQAESSRFGGGDAATTTSRAASTGQPASQARRQPRRATSAQATTRAADKPKAATDVDAETAGQAETGGDAAEAEPGPDAVPAPSSGAKARAGSGTRTKATPEPATGAEAKAGPEDGTEPATGDEVEPGTEPATGDDVEPGTEPATGDEVEPGTEPATGTEDEAGTGSDPLAGRTPAEAAEESADPTNETREPRV